MGDAGPQTPPPVLAQGHSALNTLEAQDAPPLREIKVLVTGFGPFKSFLVNPSWLIASALPDELCPPNSFSSSHPSKATYKIRLILHPSAIRVSYSTVSEIVPELIRLHDPDYILHIGMAGGRDCYSLETRAHRDGYRIKDVDNGDGYLCGECRWKKEGVPDVLYTGWDEGDVLRRWERGVEESLRRKGFLGPAMTMVSNGGTGEKEGEEDGPKQATGTGTGTGFVWGRHVDPNANASVTERRAEENRKKAAVKLSRDAGRFLCEYALYESLSRRWVEAHKVAEEGGQGLLKEQRQDSNRSGLRPWPQTTSLASERLGKVAFLHVPGWTGVEDINRGVMIAEEAVRALVGSWEDGFRRDGNARGSGSGSGSGMVGKVGFTEQNSEAQRR
ncbi:hypothetical protein LTR96_000221 [Exophiala xenobiotica]|nr:hypothetical protein LTR96_000221 [Exophiala xenobiotica]KAK5338161.1 hypothetical protein LTR98_006010 [Exophiala xenobiotica]